MLRDVDCAANPSDPVCAAFYGTSPAPAINTVPGSRVAIMTVMPANVTAWANQNSASAIASGPLSTIVGSPIATAASASPWYKTWWGIGLLAVAGVGAVHYYKQSKKAA